MWADVLSPDDTTSSYKYAMSWMESSQPIKGSEIVLFILGPAKVHMSVVHAVYKKLTEPATHRFFSSLSSRTYSQSHHG